MCRFINADEANNLAANGDYVGYNLYAYCNNKPVVCSDQNGEWLSIAIGAAVGGIVGGITAAIKGESIFVGAFSGALVGALTGAIGPAGASVGGAILGSLGIGLASAGGEYINQVGNNFVNGKRGKNAFTPTSPKEIVEAGIVGTLFAPLSIGGSKLINAGFNGLDTAVDDVAEGIVTSVVNGINSVIVGIARELV